MRRREFVTLLGGGAAAWPLAARSQQRERSLIGLLAPGFAAAQADTINAVRQGLREMGFIDGKNIAIEVALAGGQFDNLPELAAASVFHACSRGAQGGFTGDSRPGPKCDDWALHRKSRRGEIRWELCLYSGHN
jgi:putative ABC transport system substrate-binding protein